VPARDVWRAGITGGLPERGAPGIAVAVRPGIPASAVDGAARSVLEARGPQEYELDSDTFVKRLDETYGPEAAADAEPIMQAVRQATDDN